MNIGPHVFLKFVGATPLDSRRNVDLWLQAVASTVLSDVRKHTATSFRGERPPNGLLLDKLKCSDVSAFRSYDIWYVSGGEARIRLGYDSSN